MADVQAGVGTGQPLGSRGRVIPVVGASRTHSAGADGPSPYRALVAIAAVALLIRVAWVIAMPIQPESDYETFRQMRDVIRSGGWWADSFGWMFQGPLYPTVLAMVPDFGSQGLLGLQLFNSAAQTITVILVYVGARYAFGMRAGLAAAAIAAVLPGLWLFTPLLAAENLAQLLLTFIVVVVMRPPTPTGLAFAGAAAGALAFTRPAFLLFPLAVLAVALLRQSRVARRWLALSFVAGCLVATLPLINANLQNGGPLLPAAGAGWQPWLVYNERSTGQWFPAQAANDYPFQGLPEPDISGAQRKLAAQFVLANPGRAAISVAERLAITWRSDRTAIDWTTARTTGDRNRLPMENYLPALADSLYVFALALASAGAVWWLRTPVLAAIVAPLTYTVVLQLISEGNGRYHMPLLPMVAMLAGAALAKASADRIVVLALGATVALLGALMWPVAAWLAVAIATIPFVSVLTRWLHRTWRRRKAFWSTHRRTSLTAAILLTALLVVSSMAGAGWARNELEALSAVAPGGWQPYAQRPAGGAASTLGVMAIESAPERVGLRNVSYPAAVRLSFPEGPQAGDIVGISKTFRGLEVAQTHVLYLQLFDPADAGLEDEALAVKINGREVWTRPAHQLSQPQWTYIAVPWAADAPVATVQVQRTAVDVTRVGTEPVRVRSVHLYPEY